MRGSQPWKANRARVLRSRAISAETKLWSRVRNRQLGGFKFIRQAPVGKYFADFLCREKMLAVEVDGGTHGLQHEIEYDAERAAAIEQLGFRIVRVWNGDIYENIDAVLDGLLATLQGPER
jgi:very-short-patch-repair endonuclease